MVTLIMHRSLTHKERVEMGMNLFQRLLGRDQAEQNGKILH
jgi:hypothetical protein